MSSIYFNGPTKLFSDLSRYIFKYFSKIVFFSEYRVRECRVYVLSLPESIKANSIAIHTRTPGRCALSRCTMGLTGVACVLLTWREPVRVTPFFSLHRSFFFHSPFHSSLPLADLGDYSQVWRHARRRDRQYARVCGPTRAPGVYLLRKLSNLFLEFAQRIKSLIPSRLMIPRRKIYITRHVITPSAFKHRVS